MQLHVTNRTKEKISKISDSFQIQVAIIDDEHKLYMTTKQTDLKCIYFCPFYPVFPSFLPVMT